MKKKSVVFLMGFIIVVSGGWHMRSDSLAQPKEGVLDVWTTWAEDSGQLQALLDRYSQLSGMPVKVKTGVKGVKVTKAMAGSTPPDIVILSTGDPVQFYAEQGLVEPLDPWIETTGIDMDDFYPAALAQCETPDGTTLCLPWGCDVYALFWNKDLFQAAGLDPERPPQTMEELVEYADRLTVRDEEGGLSQMGFIPDFSRSHTDLYAHMFGGSWTNDDGTELAANSEPMIDAVNWQRQLYEKVGTQDVVALASSVNRYMNSDHPIYAGRRLSCQQCHRNPPRKANPDHGFYDGKVAMMVGGQWQVWPNHSSRFQPGLNYGVAPFPPPAGHPERASSTVVEGAVVVVSAGVKDKEAAASLLAWMMSPEIMAQAMVARASLPARRTAAEDPRFLNMPDWELFMDLMAHPNTKHVVTTSISPELNGSLNRVEEELLHNGGDPALLLDALQSELAPRLKETSRYHAKP